MNRHWNTGVMGCALGVLALAGSALGQQGACCYGTSCVAINIETRGGERGSACEGVFVAGGSCEAGVCTERGLCCRGTICDPTIVLGKCSMHGMPDQYAGSAFIRGVRMESANEQCTAGACCPADFDHDGTVKEQDVIMYVRDWFDGSDFTRMQSESRTQVVDLFAYLTAWFAGGC
jgi:hypothetical protein